MAKGEIVRFEQFLLLSICFQNTVCCRGVRKRLKREMVKVNKSLHNKNYIEMKGLEDQAMKHVRKHETDDIDSI